MTKFKEDLMDGLDIWLTRGRACIAFFVGISSISGRVRRSSGIKSWQGSGNDASSSSYLR